MWRLTATVPKKIDWFCYGTCTGNVTDDAGGVLRIGTDSLVHTGGLPLHILHHLGDIPLRLQGIGWVWVLVHVSP